MGDIGPLLEVIKTPLGILGLAAAAVYILSRSNARLSGVLVDQVPKLCEQVVEHAKMLLNNTKAQDATRQEIVSLRNEMRGAHQDIRELKVNLGHTDERLNNLTCRDNEGRIRQEKLLELIGKLLRRINGEDPAPGSAAPLQPTPVGGGAATKLKKTGNGPGDNNQGR